MPYSTQAALLAGLCLWLLTVVVTWGIAERRGYAMGHRHGRAGLPKLRL